MEGGKLPLDGLEASIRSTVVRQVCCLFADVVIYRLHDQSWILLHWIIFNRSHHGQDEEAGVNIRWLERLGVSHVSCISAYMDKGVALPQDE